MLLIPQILEGFLGLLKRKYPIIHDRLNPVDLDGPVHCLKFHSIAHSNTSRSMNNRMRIPRSHLLATRLHATSADDDHLPSYRSSLRALMDRARPAYLDHVVGTLLAHRQLLRRLAPILILPVVNNMAGTKLHQPLGLVLRARRRNDLRPRRHPKLQCEDADAARALRHDGVAGPQRPRAVEAVPRREPRARQRRGLLVGEVGGLVDEALLVEDGVLAQHAVRLGAQRRVDGLPGERAGREPLVEGRDGAVARLEPPHFAADADDFSCSVRDGHDGVRLAPVVGALMS